MYQILSILPSNPYSAVGAILMLAFFASFAGIFATLAAEIYLSELGPDESTWVRTMRAFRLKSIAAFRITHFFLWLLILIIGILWQILIDGTAYLLRFLAGKADA